MDRPGDRRWNRDVINEEVSAPSAGTVPPTALVVFAHHRADSLTAHVAGLAVGELVERGHRVDLLDLHREGFDPRMSVADQPDWGNREKVYSAETEAHMARMLAADLVVVVFPVYWQSVPAILKGWIDRVWNYGFAYGRGTPRLAGKRVLWLGLAGVSATDPMAEGMHALLSVQLSEGIAGYCGFRDSRVALLPDAEDMPQSVSEDGVLHIGEAMVGEARRAHYAAFDAAAVGHVREFLAAGLVPA
jgi:NAD(P)H dehydrogenase (quinone)